MLQYFISISLFQKTKHLFHEQKHISHQQKYHQQQKNKYKIYSYLKFYSLINSSSELTEMTKIIQNLLILLKTAF